MNRALIIFQKELKDMLRDRRTVFFMIVFPLLFLPLVIGGFPYLVGNISEKKMTEELTIAVVGAEHAPDLTALFAETGGLQLRFDLPESVIEDSIRSEAINAAMVFHTGFQEKLDALENADVDLYYRSSQDMDAANKRLSSVLDKYSSTIRKLRYEKLNIESSIFEPLNISHFNIASEQEMIGKMAGGWLPYIFILYCFMGAVYPALDLGAGEKERRTLETILVSPATRLEILFGKFGVIAFFSLMSAVMGVLGMLIGLKFSNEMPPELISVLTSILSLQNILIIISLILPVSIFFAALLLGLSVYARTYKEAQSIVTPLNILVIFPALIGMVPGIELDPVTAFIPVLNISLVTKDILAGTISMGLLIEVYASLIFFALLTIFWARIWFEKEQVIFRG